MKTCGNITGYDGDMPAALHLRRRRQWYGRRPLTQRNLARIAGVTTRQIRRAETAHSLPRAIEFLVRVSVALETSLEALIDPRHMRALQRDVEHRRRQVEDRSLRR